MLHPVMTIRPDDVIRSGIIQPFGVRATSPVAFARHEIDPFISAIRPTGMTATGAHLLGSRGLGIVGPEVLRTLGQQTPEERVKSLETQRWMFGAGGVVLGLLSGWLLSRML
jgi:hypothetical protein